MQASKVLFSSDISKNVTTINALAQKMMQPIKRKKTTAFGKLKNLIISAN